jgi:hypothetical protein
MRYQKSTKYSQFWFITRFLNYYIWTNRTGEKNDVSLCEKGYLRFINWCELQKTPSFVLVIQQKRLSQCIPNDLLWMMTISQHQRPPPSSPHTKALMLPSECSIARPSIVMEFVNCKSFWINFYHFHYTLPCSFQSQRTLVLMFNSCFVQRLLWRIFTNIQYKFSLVAVILHQYQCIITVDTSYYVRLWWIL